HPRAYVVFGSDELYVLFLPPGLIDDGLEKLTVELLHRRRLNIHAARSPFLSGSGKQVSVAQGSAPCCEGLDHARPCPGQVAPVVAAATGPDDAPLAVNVREFAQRPCGGGVRFFGILEMSQGIAGEAVGAALEDHEIRRYLVDVVGDTFPCDPEVPVARAR